MVTFVYLEVGFYHFSASMGVENLALANCYKGYTLMY